MTLVGLLADTHDHQSNLEKILAFYSEKGVTHLLHAGDVVAPFVKRWFPTAFVEAVDIHVVFGNNDGERDGLRKQFEDIATHHGDFGRIEIDGLSFALYHGTMKPVIDALIASGNYDVVVTGHTHHPVYTTHENGTIHVNPGEACGYLTGEPSAVVFDTQRREIVAKWPVV